MARVPQQRLDRLRGRRGVNYLPSWSTSSLDHWTEIPTAVLRRELGLVAALGLDHVRVWLSAPSWEADPDGYTANVGILADEVAAAGLDLVVQPFDSCGLERLAAEASPCRIGDLHRLAAGDDRHEFLVRWTAGPERDFFDAPALVPVTWRGDPFVALWEGWHPSPGYSRLEPAEFAHWDEYAGQVYERIGDHAALLMVEVMNEPFMTQTLRELDRDRVHAFLAHAHQTAMDALPEVPLSVGAAEAEDLAVHEAALGVPVDVVSFHSYADPVELAGRIDTARRFAGDRPVYLSEWGYFPGGDDAHQLDGYARRLPVIRAAGVSWAAFHLVAGYGPLGLSALLYPSGIMRPAAQRLRRFLHEEAA